MGFVTDLRTLQRVIEKMRKMGCDYVCMTCGEMWTVEQNNKDTPESGVARHSRCCCDNDE